MIVYDCEIEKAILAKGQRPERGIEYVSAQGRAAWRAFDEMGVSVICAYDYEADRYHVFCRDNLGAFVGLVARHDVVVGFNSIAFDDALCRAHGIDVPDEKSYDLLVEVWRAAGLAPRFAGGAHLGYSLDALAHANLSVGKSGDGARAPVEWQRGHYGHVIDYCLHDVWLTKRLVDRVIRTAGGDEYGTLVNPKDGREPLRVARPRTDATAPARAPL